MLGLLADALERARPGEDDVAARGVEKEVGYRVLALVQEAGRSTFSAARPWCTGQKKP